MYCDNRVEHDDLFQEIVAQLWQAYGRFRGEAKFSTWLYRVSLNTAITHLRKKKRRKDDAQLDDFAYQLAAEPAKDEELEEQKRVLYAAINHLNKVEKAVIMLYLEEKEYAEMAEILGITQNNIRVKMNRIRNKLKELMTNK